MKNTIVMIVFILFYSYQEKAIAQAFKKGDFDLGLGAGIGGYYKTYSNPGVSSSQIPFIGITGETCAFDKIGPGSIGIGGYLGFKSLTETGTYEKTNLGHKFIYTYKQIYRYYIIGAKAAFHYSPKTVQKLDLYGGLMIHYNIRTYNETSDDPTFNATSYHGKTGGSYASTSEFIGAKYFFKPKLGAFIEFGIGISNATIGLTYKISK